MGKLPLPESARHDEASADHKQKAVPNESKADSFRLLMKRLLTVSKDELAEQEERWKAERERRSR